MRGSVRRRSTMLLVVLAPLVGSGCTGMRPVAGEASSQLITADEIEQSRARNAYEAVSKLRRNFLSDRGPTSILDRAAPSLPNVYLDGLPYGPVASLQNIPAQHVATIRLYRAWEAQTRYGTDNPAGVIEVTTKKQ